MRPKSRECSAKFSCKRWPSLEAFSLSDERDFSTCIPAEVAEEAERLNALA